MFFFKKRKKVQTQQQPSEPAPESLCVTTVLTPEKTSILEIANLQGLGQREQQQDAFGISPADRYETDGILAVLCDGMGGMAEGQRIACQTIACLLNAFPFPEPATARQCAGPENGSPRDRIGVFYSYCILLVECFKKPRRVCIRRSEKVRLFSVSL